MEESVLVEEDEKVASEKKEKSVTKNVETSIAEDEDDEANIVMEHDLSKFSISGNNNIFLKRLRAHAKKLFLIEQKKGFKAYSKACPWQCP